jgi:hypothetical protein
MHLHRSRINAAMLALVLSACLGCGRGQQPGAEDDPPAPPPSKVTNENLDKVKEGMTLKEVEAILGPGQDSGIVGERILRAAEKRLKLPADTKWKRWRAKSSKPGFIAVGFSGGKVVGRASMGL